MLWRVKELLDEIPIMPYIPQTEVVKNTVVRAEEPFVIEKDANGIWQVTGIWMSWPVGWTVGTIISVLLYRRWHKKYILAKSPSPMVE